MKCTGRELSTGARVEISCNGVIQGVDHLLSEDPAAPYLAPGWIDLQVNGFAGADYNSPSTSHAEIARSIHVLYSTGVTRFYPTIITGGPDEMAGALRNLADAKERLEEGVAMEAFHVEGPHISPEDGPRGAHPRRWVRPPDLDEYRRWQDVSRGQVRLVTVSPEWPQVTRSSSGWWARAWS